MIAPPINYKKGVIYMLKFKAYSSLPQYPESMEVTFGKGRTPEEQSLQLINIPEVPGATEENPVTEYSIPITVEEDGIYYYGFHVTSPKFHEFLYLFDIRLDIATDVKTVKSNDCITISTSKNNIVIQNPHMDKISLYTSDGMLIDTFTETAYNRSLKSGIYIVRDGSSTHKIIIQ